MKPSFILFFILICLVVPCFAMGETDDFHPLPKERHLGADFTLPALNGDSITLSDYLGKVVILNFWATWCPPCRQEMPSMQVLYDKFKGKDFVILAVAIDRSGRSSVEPFVKKGQYTFPVLLDPTGEISAKYLVRAIPTTFILDKKGRIIEKIVGGRDWGSKAVILDFKRIIKGN